MLLCALFISKFVGDDHDVLQLVELEQNDRTKSTICFAARSVFAYKNRQKGAN